MDERTKAPAQPEQAAPPTGGSIKETIESILIAFMLAFVFRAFVVEAFVIPTGSMAPTLLGAHYRFTCQNCGYRFDINPPPNTSDSKGSGKAICPNCGQVVWQAASERYMTAAQRAPVYYGDRILVLKYLYLFQQPQRWDVVVFKSPADAPTYAMNFIKRMVGKPGETLMVLDGDIYVRDRKARADEPETPFVVQTKPRVVQDALWRIIYDNDYAPQELPNGRTGPGTPVDSPQPWRQVAGQSGWKNEPQHRRFVFDNAAGTSTLRFDPQVLPNSRPFTDWLAYDACYLQNANSVSDLKLQFYYERKGGPTDGALRLTLEKHTDVFTAVITPHQASLLRGEKTVGQPVPLNLDLSEPMFIEFMNVDYQVTLRINGRDVIRTTGAQYAPDLPRLMAAYERGTQAAPPRVEITAERQACTLTHLSLWRDVYYINTDDFDPSRNPRHAPANATPKNPMVLGADEYFVLGDNSALSSDARYWYDGFTLEHEDLRVRAGVVPGRFLLGKALFVYWPAGFHLMGRSLPALSPNFGDMRFIH